MTPKHTVRTDMPTMNETPWSTPRRSDTDADDVEPASEKTKRGRGGESRPVAEKSIVVPFTIMIDSREQLPYEFEGLTADASQERRPLIIPTERGTLPTGDYAVKGYPKGIIERKSLADLYHSISQGRANFVERLERMCMTCDFAAIVVEAGWDEILAAPPPFTQYNPKSLCRTIQAWMTRYTLVQWCMLPSRRHAELFTFRLLQRYYLDEQSEHRGSRWDVAALHRWDAALVEEMGGTIDGQLEG